MSDIKPTDLRTKTPRERAIMILAVQGKMDELNSQARVAESLKINRRTVAKYLKAPQPTIVRSDRCQQVNTLLRESHNLRVRTISTKRLVKNEEPIRILFRGVLLQTGDFLADNLEFFISLARTHLEMKPKELKEEAEFCLNLMFENYYIVAWRKRVDAKRLRWHMHKARQDQK